MSASRKNSCKAKSFFPRIFFFFIPSNKIFHDSSILISSFFWHFKRKLSNFSTKKIKGKTPALSFNAMHSSGLFCVDHKREKKTSGERDEEIEFGNLIWCRSFVNKQIKFEIQRQRINHSKTDKYCVEFGTKNSGCRGSIGKNKRWCEVRYNLSEKVIRVNGTRMDSILKVKDLFTNKIPSLKVNKGRKKIFPDNLSSLFKVRKN